MMKNKGRPKKNSDASGEQSPPLPEPDKNQHHIVRHVARNAGLKALSEIKRTKKPHGR